MIQRATVSEDVIREIDHRLIPLDQLAPHPRNYNKHPESQLVVLIVSLIRFGQVKSIVVQEGGPGVYLIVAGHGLAEAAGMIVRGEVPESFTKTKASRAVLEKRQAELRQGLSADVIPATWTSMQVEGYLVADNELARKSEVDETALLELLEAQKNAGFDLASLGTSEAEIAELSERLANALLDDQAESEEGDEEAEEGDLDSGTLLQLVDVTIAEPSHKVAHRQIWAVGPHVLLCANVFTEWTLWTPYLKEVDTLFAPFPGPLVALSTKADEFRLVMVQPDPYIAGHILDRYAEIHGSDTVKLVEP